MPSKPQAHHILTSYYKAAWKKKYGTTPYVNPYKARWGWVDGVLMEMSVEDAKELVDYYFTTASQNQHSLDWFFYNYEKLVEAHNDYKQDVERRRKIREASRLRTEEWKKSLGKPRTGTD